MPKAKADICLGFFFFLVFAVVAAVFPFSCAPIFLFPLEGPVLGSEEASGSLWPIQRLLCLGESTE